MKTLIDLDKNLNPKPSTLNPKTGFTLIEILIVVSIIGLLASIIFVGLGSSRARGRDARRVADLSSIQTGLELFFSKNGKYPANYPDDLIGGGIGVVRVPKDPSTQGDYGYSVNSSKNMYLLVADTEAAAGDAIYNSSVKSGDFSGVSDQPSPIDSGCGVDKYCVSFGL